MESNEAGILYVDDEASNRLVFGRSFEKKFRIWMAEDGPQALEILAREPVGVLLSDQRLPGMLGTELLAIVKEKYPGVVRMVLTAYSEMEVVLKAINEGLSSRYILKPWSRPMLQEVLTWGLDVYRFQGKVQELQVRLIEQERLSTIGTLMASVTHDIRNPLAYLCAYGESLGISVAAMQDWVAALRRDARLRGAFDLPQANKALEEMEDLPHVVADMMHGLETITGIVQGIQNQARRSKTNAEPAEVGQTAKLAARLVQGAVSQVGGKLQLDVPEGLPFVVLSTVELSQILLNLLVNASQALEDVTGDRSLTVRARGEGKGVRLEVQDTGTGMPPEVQARAFEQFFTTKPAGVGTGLGLANCKRIVEAAGGNIALTTAPGKGTTVSFWLPAA
ncbi:MAG TPA: ATP-binding protein [Myxococcales bacterium]|nr:ATP-binding protein [Myxococcales bacterium]